MLNLFHLFNPSSHKMNITRLKTLTYKETGRFLKVWSQTLMTPLITAALYFLVFGAALSERITELNGIAYTLFILPGLALMQSTSAAFQNPSSSIIIGKYNGSISDLLLPPLTPLEKTLGFLIGSIIRSFLVGLVILIIGGIFTGKFIPEHPLYALTIFILANGIFGLIGTITGIYAKTFDQTSAINNFIIIPMGFLSGIFYAQSMLPPLAQTLTYLNPFFYFVDGLRYAYFDQAQVSPSLALSVTFLIFSALFLTNYLAFSKGWKLQE